MFQKHSQPSIEAHERITPKATTLRQAVYGVFVEVGALGATDEEVQGRLGMDPSTQRPRRVELVNQGKIVDSGRTRLTRAGRKATVWQLASMQLGLWSGR